MLERFELREVADELPERLPLGVRQRLSLAVAVVHGPDMLILDEPTSGVDPIARDRFWALMIRLSREDGVTLFISTHFMNEAERCDRISLMHAGRVLASDAPQALVAQHGQANLEDTFIALLEQAQAGDSAATPVAEEAPARAAAPQPRVPTTAERPAQPSPWSRWFSFARLWSYAHRESLELRRDPIRLTLAFLGTALLMVIMGYGISMDVQDLRFAVLDRDQTPASRAYVLHLGGSPYFLEQAPLQSDAELDQRMRSGELSLAIEIPPGFAADLARGRPTRVGAWVDGAMPQRAETIEG